MFDAALSPQQLQVICALSEGMNSTDAAAKAGVHRNTIANWRRNSLFFRESLADAQYDRTLLFREMTEDLADHAFETLHKLPTGSEASPSVRLKAALYILDKACTPPPPRQYAPLVIEDVRAAQPTVHPVHNGAQPTRENAPSVHNPAQNAQSPFRRETPKVGRNVQGTAPGTAPGPAPVR